MVKFFKLFISFKAENTEKQLCPLKVISPLAKGQTKGELMKEIAIPHCKKRAIAATFID